ncbi:MAG: MaoC family dehydratase [Herminiimonas sp.]|nr:MaoC family dehydratase [Herminiimonas sp.]
MAQFKWYFEDMVVGQTIPVGSRTVTAEEIHAFAEAFDPQPFHVDAVAASESIYGGVIASGWHTCSMMMRLMVDNFLKDAASLGSPGVDQIRWLKPVRAGDTISVSTTAVDTRPSGSKPDRGVVETEWRAVNQDGDLVASVKGLGMFLRRPNA